MELQIKSFKKLQYKIISQIAQKCYWWIFCNFVMISCLSASWNPCQLVLPVSSHGPCFSVQREIMHRIQGYKLYKENDDYDTKFCYVCLLWNNAVSNGEISQLWVQKCKWLQTGCSESGEKTGHTMKVHISVDRLRKPMKNFIQIINYSLDMNWIPSEC